MPVTTTAAVTAAVAATNSAAASRRHDEHCKAVLTTYDASGAQPQAMREYAACVQRLYPEPQADATLTIVFAATVVAAVVAGLFTYVRESDGFLAVTVAALAGLVVLFSAMVVLKTAGA